MKALLRMRRDSKEKELAAMLSGEHDSSSCFIEVCVRYACSCLIIPWSLYLAAGLISLLDVFSLLLNFCVLVTGRCMAFNPCIILS